MVGFKKKRRIFTSFTGEWISGVPLAVTLKASHQPTLTLVMNENVNEKAKDLEDIVLQT